MDPHAAGALRTPPTGDQTLARRRLRCVEAPETTKDTAGDLCGASEAARALPMQAEAVAAN